MAKTRFKLSNPARTFQDPETGEDRTHWADMPVSIFRNETRETETRITASVTIVAEHDITLKKGERYVLFSTIEKPQKAAQDGDQREPAAETA